MSKLFIFLHVPATGGNTLIDGFKKKHGPDSTFYIPAIKKDSAAVEAAIKALSAEERGRIRLIHSHALWYGVHEFFDREPFYFTFMRDPISRVVSLYFKLRRMDLTKPPYVDFHRIGAALPFHVSVKRPGDFESAQHKDFVSSYPYAHNHMTILYGRKGAKPFYNLDDCGKVDAAWLERARDHLSRFSFVGLHDTYAQDAEALGDVMGGLEKVPAREARVERQSDDRELANDPRVLLDVVKNNAYDMALYESVKLKRENTKMNTILSAA